MYSYHPESTSALRLQNMNAQIDAMQKAADAQRQAILKQLEGQGFGIQTATKMNH